MDLIFLKLWTQEISKKIINRDFKRIFRNDDNYILEFRNGYLTISLFSGDPICFLSSERVEQKEKTSFNKLISQHLNKSKVEKISIAKNDKVISIYFQNYDIYSEKVKYKLIIELINRYENLIFTRQDENYKWIILDSHRRISFSESRYRQILPGQEYQFPPKLQKPYILDLDKDRFSVLIGDKLPQEWKKFIQHFSNMPRFFKYKFISKMQTENFWQVISKIKKKLNILESDFPESDKLNTIFNSTFSEEHDSEIELKHIVFYNPEEKLLSLIRTKNSQGFSKINDAFHFYYKEKCRKAQLTHLKNKILGKLKKHSEQIEKTLKRESEELSQMENADKWKKFGELLKINFNKIKKGFKEIEVTDYYAENTPQIIIPLNKEWYPKKNMEHYFRQYRKAKSGKAKLTIHIKSNEKKLHETLEKLKYIDTCDDIESLKIFIEKGEISKKINIKKHKFRKFSVDVKGKEWEIFIGRNNKENDELTIKYAKPDDWFFHSRIFHGAHIVVRNPNKLENLPEKVKYFAAGLSAYFSKAKHSTKVPVDFTRIRYVSKPRKSPPGFVIYRNQKTLFVDPIDPRKNLM